MFLKKENILSKFFIERSSSRDEYIAYVEQHSKFFIERSSSRDEYIAYVEQHSKFFIERSSSRVVGVCFSY